MTAEVSRAPQQLYDNSFTRGCRFNSLQRVSQARSIPRFVSNLELVIRPLYAPRVRLASRPPEPPSPSVVTSGTTQENRELHCLCLRSSFSSLDRAERRSGTSLCWGGNSVASFFFFSSFFLWKREIFRSQFCARSEHS